MRETHSLMLMAAAALAKSVEKEKNAKNNDKDTVSVFDQVVKLVTIS